MYMTATGSCKKENKVQTAILLHCAGPQVLEIYDQHVWAEDGDEDKPIKVLEMLEKYCNPRKNEVLESHRFWNIQYQEPFDVFLTELRTRASACNYHDKDRMIRDKIVLSVTGKLQELLLREDKLDLQKAISTCRAYEQSNKHVQEIREKETSVNKIFPAKKTTNPKSKTTENDEKVTSNGARPKVKTQKPCSFCGYTHSFQSKETCPAWGKTCNNCGGRNHFRSRCKKERVNTVEADSDDEFWLAYVDAESK